MAARGRPSFNTLKNYFSSEPTNFYVAFDLLILAGRESRSEPFDTQRQLLKAMILRRLDEPILDSRNCKQARRTSLRALEINENAFATCAVPSFTSVNLLLGKYWSTPRARPGNTRYGNALWPSVGRRSKSL